MLSTEELLKLTEKARSSNIDIEALRLRLKDMAADQELMDRVSRSLEFWNRTYDI